MNNSTCKRDLDRLTATNSGYVVFTADDEDTINGILLAKNILHQYVPYGYELWVKRWVAAAVDTYLQNGGFAGMTLTEYLDKMANEQLKE